MGNVERSRERRILGLVISSRQAGQGELNENFEFSDRGAHRLEDVARELRPPMHER